MFKYVELGTAWQTLFKGKLASVSPRYSYPCFLDEDLCLTSYINKSCASSLAFQFRWNKDCIILIKNRIKGAVWISLYFIPQLDAKTLAIFSRFSANSLVFDSGHYVLLVSFLSFSSLFLEVTLVLVSQSSIEIRSYVDITFLFVVLPLWIRWRRTTIKAPATLPPVCRYRSSEKRRHEQSIKTTCLFREFSECC